MKLQIESPQLRAWFSALTLAVAACGILEPRGESRVLWRVNGEGWGTPAFDSSAVYFLGANHNVVAVNKATGAVIWQRTTGDPGTFSRGHGTIVVGNLVVVGDNDIHVYDRTTGVKRMTFSPADGYSPGLFDLATDGQNVYAGSPSGYAYAFDPATAELKWAAPIATDNNTSVFNPVFDNGIVYLCVTHFTNPKTGGVVAVDAVSGAELWRVNMPATGGLAGGCYGKVVLVASRGFAATNDGRIHTFDKVSGSVHFVIPRITNIPFTGGNPEWDLRPLVMSGNSVVAGSTTGYILAYDATTGSEQWRGRANRGSASYPLAADAEHVYAVHDGFQLAAFRASDGSVAWLAGDNPSPDEFVYTPAVDSNKLYVGGTAGLYALRK